MDHRVRVGAGHASVINDHLERQDSERGIRGQSLGVPARVCRHLNRLAQYAFCASALRRGDAERRAIGCSGATG